MISNETNGILSAWRIVFARIDAMIVDARPVAGTLEIGMAFDAFASFEWTAFVARLASARRSVIVAKAFGIHGTWVGQCAWIDAFVVVTCLVVGAFIVRLARQFEATELRVARVAWFAHTNRMMVLHVTIGVDATIARTRTQFIHARFGQCALGVGFASDSHIGSCKKKRFKSIKNRSRNCGTKKCTLTWNATNQWTSGETGRTFANRLMIFRIAEGSMTAWIRVDARINASFVSAHAIAGTIRIGIAFGRSDGVRISWNCTKKWK